MSNASKINQIMKNGILVRERFDFKKYKLTRWFPRHMNTGLHQIQTKIRNIDCIIEVHDARVPFTGRNHLIEKEIAQIKPHILVLNKVDLISQSETKMITQQFKRITNNSFVLFTNCKNQGDENIRSMTNKIIDSIKASDRHHRAFSPEFSVMIMGIPNVGKSSLINALRAYNLSKGRATPIGANPGVTKSVLERIKICIDPPIYIRDTPGILMPVMRSAEEGLKLALINTMQDHLIGEDIIADYLLYKLNSNENHSYADILKLERPTDNIQEVLNVHAIKNNMALKTKSYKAEGGFELVPDMLRAAKNFLNLYRKGQFGNFILDSVHL